MRPDPAGLAYVAPPGCAGATVTYNVTAHTNASASDIARELEWSQRMSGR